MRSVHPNGGSGNVSGQGSEASAKATRHPPFVGRGTQLGALKSAVDAAELGESVLVLVAGEPGIGKTRIIGELASRTSVKTLWGACWDGEGAPAYWPWRQVVRSIGANDEQVLVEATARLDQLSPAETGAGSRFPLFDAVADGLANASAVQPLMLVLEDLHWADDGTIKLLQFLARDTRPRRLAIIGTYRDTDLDPAHPLSVGLAELVRDGLHINLGGLGPRDVASLVSSVRGESSEETGAVARLHRQSGGNPFFLWQLLQLERLDGAREGTPPSIRAVVSRRLDRLPGVTRETLAAASILGTDVDLALVASLVKRSGTEAWTVLTTAESAGLISPTPNGGFAFVHALVREVLYAGLDITVRAAWHQRAAAALEERYGDARPAEVAHHLFEAALGGPDDRCLSYAVRAAERSWDVHGYDEAGHWYARALQALRPGDPREGDLQLRCGEAQLAAGNLFAARAAYERAAELGRTRGDAEQLANAALGLGAGLGGFEVQLLDPLQVDLLEEALAVLGPEPSAMRAWVLARLSVALSLMADESRRQSISQQAVAVARSSGDSRALGYALAGSAMADLLGQVSTDPRFTAGPPAVIAALTGDHALARALLAEWLASGLPDRIRDSEWLPETAQLAQVAVATGAHDAASRLYADLRPYAHRFCVEGIGAAFTGSVAWYLDQLARFLGRTAEAEAYGAQATHCPVRTAQAAHTAALVRTSR